MKTCALLLCAFTVALATQVEPGTPAFRGFSGLKPSAPTVSGASRKYSHFFHHISSTGRHTYLKYEAETETAVHNIDEWSELVSVSCQSTSLVLTFKSGSSSPALEVNEFLVGSHKWGCTRKINDSVNVMDTIRRKVISVATTDNVVTVTTGKVNLQHIFKHAKVKFFTNHFGPDVEGQQSSGDAPSPTSRKPLGFFSHLWDDAKGDLEDGVRDVKDLGEKLGTAVYDAAKDVGAVAKDMYNVGKDFYEIGKALITGDLNKEFVKQEQLSWNYQSGSAKSVDINIPDGDVSVTCQNCYANVDVSFHLDLVIHDHHVVTVAACIEGDAEARIRGILDATVDLSKSFSKQIADIPIDEIPFAIGPVPVLASINLLVNLELNFEVESITTLDITATVPKRSVAIGVVYGAVPDTYPWNQDYNLQQQSDSWQHMYTQDSSGPITASYNGNEEIKTVITASIIPGVELMIDTVIGASFDIGPYVTDTIVYNLDEDKIENTLDVGFTVDVSAEINLFDLLKKSFGPYAVYTSPAWQISDRSYSLSVPDVVDAPAVTDEGILPSASIQTTSVDVACSGNGVIHGAACTCFEGWHGVNCSVSMPTHTRMPCEHKVVAAANLTTCAHLNGENVCLSTGTLAALEAEVRTRVARFDSSGPACTESMSRLQCELLAPPVRDGVHHGQKVCFDDCSRVYQICGASKVVADKKCMQGQASGFSRVARPHVTSQSSFVQPSQCSSILPSDSITRTDDDASTCVEGTNLKHCSIASGRRVHLESMFTSLADADARIGSMIQVAVASLGQIDAQTKAACEKAFSVFFCSEFMPSCSVSGFQVTMQKLCPGSCSNLLQSCPPLAKNTFMCSLYTVPSVDATIARPGQQCSYAEFADARKSSDHQGDLVHDVQGNVSMSYGALFGICVAMLAVGVGSVLVGQRLQKRTLLQARRSSRLNSEQHMVELSEPMISPDEPQSV